LHVYQFTNVRTSADWRLHQSRLIFDSLFDRSGTMGLACHHVWSLVLRLPLSGCTYERRLSHFFVRSPWCQRHETQNRRPFFERSHHSLLYRNPGRPMVNRELILWHEHQFGGALARPRHVSVEAMRSENVFGGPTQWSYAPTLYQVAAITTFGVSLSFMLTTVKVQSRAWLLPKRATRSHSVTYPTLADLVRIYVFRSSRRVIRICRESNSSIGILFDGSYRCTDPSSSWVGSKGPVWVTDLILGGEKGCHASHYQTGAEVLERSRNQDGRECDHHFLD
jgi:hypothetical protein